jgi:hypothetical protein
VHTFISFLPLAVTLALITGGSWWDKRLAYRAQWTKLSLRQKIARNLRALSLAIALQAGFLAWTAFRYATGRLPFGAWLPDTIAAVFYLTALLWLLRDTLRARKAYNALGPLAYLAEIQHAFGSVTAAGLPDVTAHNLAEVAGRRHFGTCDCGHCPA